MDHECLRRNKYQSFHKYVSSKYYTHINYIYVKSKYYTITHTYIPI